MEYVVQGHIVILLFGSPFLTHLCRDILAAILQTTFLLPFRNKTFDVSNKILLLDYNNA